MKLCRFTRNSVSSGSRGPSQTPRCWRPRPCCGTHEREGRCRRSRTKYHPPTPPQKSVFHRYQFMLFEQLPDVPVPLTEQEKSSHGNDSAHQHLESTALLAPAGSSIMYQH